MEMGAQIELNPDEIEPNNVYLEVNLQPDTPTDRQGRLDMAVKTVQFLNTAPRKAMEDNGIDYTEMDIEEYKEHMLNQAQIQAESMKIQASAELEIQQQQMQMQIQGQQQAQAGQMRAQEQEQQMMQNQIDPFANTRGMGRTDGNPPINTRPGVGREQINNRTNRGDELA